jgi:hypothetical protein
LATGERSLRRLRLPAPSAAGGNRIWAKSLSLAIFLSVLLQAFGVCAPLPVLLAFPASENPLTPDFHRPVKTQFNRLDREFSIYPISHYSIETCAVVNTNSRLVALRLSCVSSANSGSRSEGSGSRELAGFEDLQLLDDKWTLGCAGATPAPTMAGSRPRSHEIPTQGHRHQSDSRTPSGPNVHARGSNYIALTRRRKVRQARSPYPRDPRHLGKDRQDQ